MAEPDRTLGGHRLYPVEAVTSLRVIKAAQRLGFTLEEIVDLIDTGRHQHRPIQGLSAKTEAKLAEVEARIRDLQVIADTLHAALDAGCDDLTSCVGSACCPIPFASLAANTDGQP